MEDRVQRDVSRGLEEDESKLRHYCTINTTQASKRNSCQSEEGMTADMVLADVWRLFESDELRKEGLNSVRESDRRQRFGEDCVLAVSRVCNMFYKTRTIPLTLYAQPAAGPQDQLRMERFIMISNLQRFWLESSYQDPNFSKIRKINLTELNLLSLFGFLMKCIMLIAQLCCNKFNISSLMNFWYTHLTNALAGLLEGHELDSFVDAWRQLRKLEMNVIDAKRVFDEVETDPIGDVWRLFKEFEVDQVLSDIARLLQEEEVDPIADVWRLFKEFEVDQVLSDIARLFQEEEVDPIADVWRLFKEFEVDQVLSDIARLLEEEVDPIEDVWGLFNDEFEDETILNEKANFLIFDDVFGFLEQEEVVESVSDYSQYFVVPTFADVIQTPVEGSIELEASRMSSNEVFLATEQEDFVESVTDFSQYFVVQTFADEAAIEECIQLEASRMTSNELFCATQQQKSVDSVTVYSQYFMMQTLADEDEAAIEESIELEASKMSLVERGIKKFKGRKKKRQRKNSKRSIEDATLIQTKQAAKQLAKKEMKEAKKEKKQKRKKERKKKGQKQVFPQELGLNTKASKNSPHQVISPIKQPETGC